MRFSDRKLASSTVTQHLAALRFLYVKVLKRGWSIAETPYPKNVQRLPLVLILEDVAKLIDAADSPFHRILLMTLYATRLALADTARPDSNRIPEICAFQDALLHRALHSFLILFRKHRHLGCVDSKPARDLSAFLSSIKY
jgi:hypothetical protein